MLQMCRRKAGVYENIDGNNAIEMTRAWDRKEEGMLVLSRKVAQQIIIGQDIRITVLKIDRNQVRIGIEAPRDICILRKELGDHDAAKVRTPAEPSLEETHV